MGDAPRPVHGEIKDAESDAGAWSQSLVSNDGRRVAFVRTLGVVDGERTPCETLPELPCNEVWIAEKGRAPTRLFDAVGSEPVPVTGIELLKFSADDERLFFHSHGGFIANHCLWSIRLADRSATCLACAGAILVRENRVAPFADTIVISHHPLRPGGGRAWGTLALITVDGRWLRNLPDDRKLWAPPLRE